MLPPPTFLISGMACFAPRNTDLRSTVILESHTSSERSTALPLEAVKTSKALLKRMSNLPHLSTALRTILSMSECLLTSTRTATASLPAVRIFSAFSSPVATSMSAMSTFAPSSASRLEVAPPDTLSASRNDSYLTVKPTHGCLHLLSHLRSLYP